MGRTKKISEQIESYEPEDDEKADFKDPNLFIPTGSTLLNLAMTDLPNGGWQIGKIANLIGDSSTGKTCLALTTFAEAAQLERFDDYRFIFDDAECANEFDVSRMFGQKVADRLEAPRYIDDEPEPSETIEDFHDNVLNALENGRPFIYILDSFDSISAEADNKKIEEHRDARAKGKETKGSYGMAKAKKSSEILRHIRKKLKTTKSALIIISQTRDDINPMTFAQKTRSGGNALRFYSTHELWLAHRGKIKSKDEEIGNDSRVRISKNKVTGKRREVPMRIYNEIGVDDIVPSIDFLVAQGVWRKSGQKIVNNLLGKDNSSSLRKIINYIEENDLEKDLTDRVARAWYEKEESLKQNRKRRYS